MTQLVNVEDVLADALRTLSSATAASAHTPEPWYVQPSDYPGGLLIKPIPGQVIAQCDQVPEMETNARRICAAVNACKGISTEALEGGIIADLQQVLGELLTAAADLDAAIDGVTDQFDDERTALDAAYRAAEATLAKAAGHARSALQTPFIIVVRGGIVQAVHNVPPGYEYEIRDYDSQEETADEGRPA
jgi:hypothetical protein